MSPVRKALFLATALVAVGNIAFAADPAAPASKSATATAPTVDLQNLMQQFNARRDAYLANREALLNQLKSATEEQKKAILAKMAADEKDLKDAQRAMAKQMRDEMRKQLRATPPPGGHR